MNRLRPNLAVAKLELLYDEETQTLQHNFNVQNHTLHTTLKLSFGTKKKLKIK